MLQLLLISVILYEPTTSNVISPPCSKSHDDEYNGTAANCSKRNFQSVPKDLPRDIVVLLLQDNQIRSLHNNVFCIYPKLRLLNLDINRIRSLDVKSFSCMSQLETLSLGSNPLGMDVESFPNGVFKPLINLKSLFLHASLVVSEGEFPSYIFDDIQNLTTLGIGWWPDGSARNAFSKLHRLEQFVLESELNCNLRHLDNVTFVSLQRLPIFDLHIYCTVLTLNSSPFRPFRKLKSLKFKTTTRSLLSLQNITDSFGLLVGRKFSKIDLSYFQRSRRREIRIINLNRKSISHLLDMCVENLILSYNRIEQVNTDIFSPTSTLTRCLRYLDVSHNPINGQGAAFFYLTLMPNLRRLDLSHTRDSFHSLQTQRDTELYQFRCPPNLKAMILHTSSTRVTMNSVCLTNCSNLVYVDFGDMKSCTLGNVTGISKLKHLDVSNCVLYESFFASDFVNTTESLILRSATFNFDIIESVNLMTSLQKLDLTSTGLTMLASESLHHLKYLTSIILKGNTFDTVPINVAEMPSLARLDLSDNALRVVSSDTRSQLDAAAENRDLYLLLEGNIFSCSCETLAFVSWLQRTKVKLDLNGNYSCVLKESRRSDTHAFYNKRIRYWRTCIGMSLLLGTVIVYFLLLLSVLFTLVILKYYHNIEQYILNITGYNVKLRPKRKDFKYDTYACYADNDYQWPCHCLRQELQIIDENINLYIPDLDEPLGMPKAEAIIDALSSSWKVVIVISENTLIDDWSYFTLLSAVRLFSTHNVISNRIILLYKNATPAAKAKVPEFLLNVLSENYIVEFEDTYTFWTDLYDLITCEDVVGYS